MSLSWSHLGPKIERLDPAKVGRSQSWTGSQTSQSRTSAAADVYWV